MTERLPPNVYRVAQRRFDAIPGAPWVYYISESLRGLFETLPLLSSAAIPRQGLTTADNPRFIRYWWEVELQSIGFGCADRNEACQAGKRWYPLVKGGQAKRWYGGEISIGNWENDGQEIKSYIVERYPYLNGKWEWVAKNPEYYFREGAAYSAVTSGGLYFRWMPQGFICEHASNAVYSEDRAWPPRLLVGLFNSTLANFIVGLNETINVNIDDLLRMPVCKPPEEHCFESAIRKCIYIRECEDSQKESYWSFLVPPHWDTGLDDLTAAKARLADLERQIDEEVYRLYGISDEDRAAIKAELAGGPTAADEDDETEHATRNIPPMTREELAVRWIAYAVGVVLGRFRPGVPCALGSAVYRRADFAVGSLPAPDEAEFDQLVGPPERFAYVDADGGRHLFPAQVEAALRDLSVPDGITVLDKGHERDLPALVEQALHLMLDWHNDTQHAARNTDAVIEVGAGGDLRRFLERDFFTRWHLRWYRKRPVYWPLQSARRSYGFILFHERVERSTLYVLQREYLDHKLNGLRLQIGDLRGRAESLSGAARKRVERKIDRATQLLDELTAFAQTMERVVREGYEPAPDWIDDGVILRLAPLWELIPIWWREPKKYWERLQRGDYDWSHVALRYWPERVREKCKANKSYAIAHGHGEWYQG
ncbi:MAG TPA: hypothetical protein ENI39_07395 [Anaerolineae bacterium]|nr:hypothetical protein [Anaerolineae bacterium]